VEAQLSGSPCKHSAAAESARRSLISLPPRGSALGGVLAGAGGEMRAGSCDYAKLVGCGETRRAEPELGWADSTLENIYHLLRCVVVLRGPSANSGPQTPLRAKGDPVFGSPNPREGNSGCGAKMQKNCNAR